MRRFEPSTRRWKWLMGSVFVGFVAQAGMLSWVFWTGSEDGPAFWFYVLAALTTLALCGAVNLERRRLRRQWRGRP